MATYPSPTLQNLTVNGIATLTDVSSAAATITGGTIDGTPIGATTPASVHATTINSTGAATLASVSTASATLTGGTVDGVMIGGTTPDAIHATTLSASGTVSGAGFTTLLSPYSTSATLAGTAVGDGAYLIGYQLNATGSVARTVESALNTPIIDAKNFGVDPSSTDNAPGINAAIAYAASLGGGEIALPAGTLKVASTISITATGITLRGAGSGVSHDGGTNASPSTTLFWQGTTGTVVDVRTPNSTTIAMQSYMGVRDLAIDGDAAANTGLSFTSVRGPIAQRIYVANCITQQYLFTTYARSGYAEATDTQLGIIEDCTFRCVDSAAVQSAHGFTLTSASPNAAGANTSFNQFKYCGGHVYNGNAWNMLDADNNTFIGCSALPVNTGLGLLLGGVDDNYFWGFSCGGSGKISIKGTASGYAVNPANNTFYNSDETNNTQYPTLDANCYVQWHGAIHGSQKLRATTGIFSGSTARTSADLANLGNATLLIDNGSQDHVVITDGTNTFGVAIDGNGYLRFINLAGGGSYYFSGALRFTGGTAAPTSGTWQTADLVWNTAPSVLGTSGSQYIIDHWRCVASGTPGTWVACRTLTGT